MSVAVDILDSVGVAIWLGDNVTAPDGTGSVTALIEVASADGDPLSSTAAQVVVTVGSTQFIYTGAQVTVTSRASEQAITADQVSAGVVN